MNPRQSTTAHKAHHIKTVPFFQWTLSAHFALFFLFLYLPVITLMIFSLNGGRYAAVWDGFSMKWYGELFQNRAIGSALKTTLILALSSTAIATVLGTSLALGSRYLSPRAQNRLESICYLPIMAPDIVLAIAFLLFFTQALHWRLGLVPMIIAHATFNTCYVGLLTIGRTRTLDPALEEAAYDLGASRWMVFRKVTLPGLWPSVVGGSLLAMALSLDEFVIAFFLAGAGANTLPIEIFSQVKRGVTPEINALATVILIISFLLAGAGLWIRNKGQT